jgi:hypothetical protein
MTCLNEAALCQANYKSKPHCNASARQVGPDVSRDLILMQDHPREVVQCQKNAFGMTYNITTYFITT